MQLTSLYFLATANTMGVPKVSLHVQSTASVALRNKAIHTCVAQGLVGHSGIDYSLRTASSSLTLRFEKLPAVDTVSPYSIAAANYLQITTELTE